MDINSYNLLLLKYNEDKQWKVTANWDDFMIKKMKTQEKQI